MTARTTRRTRLIAAVSATAGALALTLLPTTAAHAAVLPTVPVFSYIDNTTLDPRAGTADSGTTDTLVPAGYRAYDVDVTPDGATSVMSLCNGSLAACTDNPAGSRFDATYGVLLLHTESPGVVSSRLLTNLTSTNPVISADGSKAMWIYGSTLHIFDTAAETYSTSALAAPKVATEFPTRLAVSADGSNVAVMYRDATGATAGRVLAFPTAATTLTGATYFQKTYPKTVTAPAKPLRPSSASFTFVGNTNIVYNEVDGTNPQTSTTPRDAVQGTLSLDNATPGTPALAVSLQDFYRLRQDATGSWWAWKDVDGSGAASTTDATVSNIDDPLAATPVIQTGPTRTDSATTYGYTPSTVTPPVPDFVTTNTGNLAASHPTFTFSAATVLYNGRSAYQTYNLYGGQPNGAYTTPAAAAETDRAFLQQSFDGKTWTSPGLQTSGARAFVLGTQFYNGYLTSLRRNTFYRWTWVGDAFTTTFTTSSRKITVIPLVSATAKVSGRYRIVSGVVTRPTGTVYLYRKVGTKYVYVSSARVVKTATFTGKYAFAKRALARGTYKVATVADAYMASGAKVFSI